MQDEQLGRWNGIDELAEKYVQLSPYNYAANNPVKYLDLDGKVIKVFGDEAIPKIEKLINQQFGKNVLGDYTNETSGYLKLKSMNTENMTNDQKAVYELLSGMIASPKEYSVSFIERGNANGAPISFDSYQDGELYYENLNNIKGSDFFTPLLATYHFFDEQKYRQDGQRDDYATDHNQTEADQLPTFGLQWTETWSTTAGDARGVKYDQDLIDANGGYIATLRASQGSNGEWSLHDFTMKGHQTGEKINSHWRKQRPNESINNLNYRQNVYYNQNPKP